MCVWQMEMYAQQFTTCHAFVCMYMHMYTCVCLWLYYSPLYSFKYLHYTVPSTQFAHILVNAITKIATYLFPYSPVIAIIVHRSAFRRGLLSLRPLPSAAFHHAFERTEQPSTKLNSKTTDCNMLCRPQKWLMIFHMEVEMKNGRTNFAD